MSETAIRARIKTLLEGVSGIGTVHNRRRYSRSFAEWLKLMRSNSVVNGWTIHRLAAPATRDNHATIRREHTYEINGFYALDDDSDSQTTFEALIESIFDAFKNDWTLNGTAMNTAPLQVEEIDEMTIEGTTFHNCTLVLVAYDRELYT